MLKRRDGAGFLEVDKEEEASSPKGHVSVTVREPPAACLSSFYHVPGTVFATRKTWQTRQSQYFHDRRQEDTDNKQ